MVLPYLQGIWSCPTCVIPTWFSNLPPLYLFSYSSGSSGNRALHSVSQTTKSCNGWKPDRQLDLCWVSVCGITRLVVIHTIDIMSVCVCKSFFSYCAFYTREERSLKLAQQREGKSKEEQTGHCHFLLFRLLTISLKRVFSMFISKRVSKLTLFIKSCKHNDGTISDFRFGLKIVLINDLFCGQYHNKCDMAEHRLEWNSNSKRFPRLLPLA